MKKMNRESLTKYKKLLANGAAFFLFVAVAHAQYLNGTLDSGFYGSPLAVQTINTGFGDSAGGNDSAGGSELDAAYGNISGGNLYLFVSGNLENNGNHLNVFIDGGAPGGQNTLNVTAPGNPGPVMGWMNGSVFSPGFNATFAFDMNDYAGTLYSEEYTLTSPGNLTGGYVGVLSETSIGIAAGSDGGVTSLYLNNNNASTMGVSGAAYFGGAAVTTGLEMVIPLSAIGWSGGSIKVLADINGSYPADTYLSNQFLPGLPVGTANVGTGGTPYSGPFSSAPGAGGTGEFNLANASNEYFTVPAPEPTTLVLGGLGVAALFLSRRKSAG